MKNIVAKIVFSLGRFARKSKTTFVFALANKFLDGYANRSYTIESNGERYILERIASVRPKVLFDVGAHTGEWTCTAAELIPSAQIHSFEISSKIFCTLKLHSEKYSSIQIVNKGLADFEGETEFYLEDSALGMTSIVTQKHLPAEAHKEIAQVITGDTYCKEQKINHIDMLKIDVEGAESKVLAGFKKMLADGSIDIIQFEYGRVNIFARFLLYDFYCLLGEKYQIGKLLPKGVDFKDYRVEEEDFRGANYIAVNRNRSDIIELLRRG